MKRNDRFFSKKVFDTSTWNSIWQDWVFCIWGQIQILWKYLVFEIKYKYLKAFGIPNKLKVLDPPLHAGQAFSAKMKFKRKGYKLIIAAGLSGFSRYSSFWHLSILSKKWLMNFLRRIRDSALPSKPSPKMIFQLSQFSSNCYQTYSWWGSNSWFVIHNHWNS